MSILPIVDVIGGIVDKVIPDANEKMRLKMELAKYADAEAARASNERIAQTEVNKAEAAHSAIFVAGWRPFVGWCCGVAFIYTAVAAPAFGWGVADLSFIRDILLGMLGISVGARTIEKVKGVAENTLNPQADTQVSKPKKNVLKKIGDAVWPF